MRFPSLKPTQWLHQRQNCASCLHRFELAALLADGKRFSVEVHKSNVDLPCHSGRSFASAGRRSLRRSSSMKDASHVKISSVCLHAKFTMLLKCIGRPLPFDLRRRDSIVDLCDCTGNLGHSGSERSFECQSSARASAKWRL